jgi:hypothetical protein
MQTIATLQGGGLRANALHSLFIAPPEGMGAQRPLGDNPASRHLAPCLFSQRFKTA